MHFLPLIDPKKKDEVIEKLRRITDHQIEVTEDADIVIFSVKDFPEGGMQSFLKDYIYPIEGLQILDALELTD